MKKLLSIFLYSCIVISASDQSFSAKYDIQNLWCHSMNKVNNSIRNGYYFIRSDEWNFIKSFLYQENDEHGHPDTKSHNIIDEQYLPSSNSRTVVIGVCNGYMVAFTRREAFLKKHDKDAKYFVITNANQFSWLNALPKIDQLSD